MQILLFSGCIFVYCAICHFFDMSMIWYQNVPCLVFGMIYYAGKEYIDRQLETRAWGILAICGILFAGCTALAYIGEIPVIFDVLYFVFFVCCIISLSYILANTRLIQNSFFALCGAYSLEIYVTHGLFLRLIKIKYIEQLPVYVYVLLVIVGTILMSVLMKKVYRAIVLILKKKYRKTYQ